MKNNKSINSYQLSATSYNKNNGFITLISVLIAGAVAVAVATSVILLGVDATRTSFALGQSYKAKSLANACIEEALEQIREATSFSGSGNLTLGDGTCSYTVTDTGGETRTINSSGVVQTYVRKMRVLVTEIIPNITISSWQEVAD